MPLNAPEPKWYQRWWSRIGPAVIAAFLGAAVPQLCGLIPNAPGQKVCAVVVNAFVSGLTADTQPTNAPPPPPTPPLEECAPERRLSTGKCLPP